MDPRIDMQLFCLLCSAAGVPNTQWQSAYTAIFTETNMPNFTPGIPGMAALDKAIRAWWKSQGGVILGTALILSGLLNG